MVLFGVRFFWPFFCVGGDIFFYVHVSSSICVVRAAYLEHYIHVGSKSASRSISK